MLPSVTGIAGTAPGASLITDGSLKKIRGIMKTEVLIKGEVRYLPPTLINGKNDEVDVLSQVDFCLLPIWRSEIFAGSGY